MPLPAGRFFFFLPKLFVDSRQRMHMFWGEPADTLLPNMGMPMIVSLWHSSYERGRWSSPEKVFYVEGQWFAWEDQMQVAGVDGRGGLHVAFPASQGGVPFMYVRRDPRGQWSVRQIAPFAVYGSITAWDESVVAVSYVVLDTAGPVRGTRSSYSLVTMLSRDGGETWAQPVRVPVASAPLVRSPVITMANGIVHLAWVSKAAGAPGDGNIQHATISAKDFARGSSEWRIWPEVTLRSGAHLRFTFSVSRCGSSMAAIETVVRKSATELMPATDVVLWPAPSAKEDSTVSTTPLFSEYEGVTGAGLRASGGGFDVVFAAITSTPGTQRTLVSHRDVCPAPAR